MKFNNAILLFQGSQLGNHVHPFVISEVEAFCAKFDNVYLVCFEYDKNITDLDGIGNLKTITVPIHKASRIFGAIKRFFLCKGFENLSVAIKNRLISKNYLKVSAQVLLFGTALEKEAKKIIRNNPNSEWVVESYWLSGSALAAARLREKYKNVYAFSRAHSSEIDFVRNPPCVCQYKKYIYENLDNILFISQWGKDNFEKTIMPKHGLTDFSKNRVARLGVDKKYDALNVPSSDGVFRILSCSRAVKLKRMDMIAEALSKREFKRPICWTHIGDGPELPAIKKLMSDSCPNVEFNALGSMANSEVHRYLSEHPVDLFVNASVFEGLPVSIMEAAAYGIPVLATSAGATSEIVDLNNGLLVQNTISSDEFAGAIESFVNCDFERLQALRHGSYETWKEKYNKKENYQMLFENLGE